MEEVSRPLTTAAEDVAQVASGLTDQMDADRRLSPDVFKAILDAGFMRHFVSPAHGGRGGTFAELLPAVATIGETCAASAWCASLFAHTPRFVEYLPAEGRAEVWADGPDAAVVGSVVPFGEATAEGDGWRVSGRWPYMSGIEVADWVVVCAKVMVDGTPGLRLFALRRTEVQVEDTWFSVGMQATGSITAIVDGVVVPPSRVGDRVGLFTGRKADPAAEPPVAALAPLPAGNGLTFVGPALGAARGALALFGDYIAKKIRDAPPLMGVPGVAGNRSTYETVLARSAAEIDAAQVLLERVAAVADDPEAVTPPLLARGMRDSSFAIDLLVTATNRIFRTAGTSGQTAGGPLQRFWRDVNSVATHQALQFEPISRNYAKVLYGLD
jgi:alkylation response protein AidB-like acyl-CoA dehydrogenase